MSIVHDRENLLREVNGQLNKDNIKRKGISADRLEDNSLDGSKFALGTGGQIYVANANGVFTPVTMSGDVTVNNTGVSAIAAAYTTARDAHLATYRTLFHAVGVATNASAAAGAKILGSNFSTTALPQNVNAMTTGVNYTTAANNLHHEPIIFPLRAADYAITGKTTQLRVLGLCAVNGTAVGSDVTFSLRNVTSAGAANSITYTAASSVASSTVTLTNPAANSTPSGVSADFNLPADGAYVLCAAHASALAASSFVSFHAWLQLKWV